MPRPRYYLAKSADTGKCGNKAGLPSTVGVSLHREEFSNLVAIRKNAAKLKHPMDVRDLLTEAVSN